MELIEKIYQIYRTSGKVSTDTRKISEGDLFFALKGPNFNGNEYAQQAIEKGASAVIIDEEQYKIDDRCFIVPDALKALQDLALFHRRKLKIPFVAITGSNGKTTTKELIKAVLSRKYRTFATEGNLNNHIGIPLTILSIHGDIEIAVIEMGANHQKEIEGYCKIAEPTHGLITNTGKAHLEGFGGIEGVKKGKGELYQYLSQSGGTAFINSQNSMLQEISPFHDPVTYPAKGDFYHCKFLEADPFVKIRTEGGKDILTKLIGKYNYENAAAALCIGKYFTVDAEMANQAVQEYLPSSNRSQIIEKKGNTIILDAYNANPSSMKEALENFAAIKAEKKMVVLGDMNELGPDSEVEHELMGKFVASKNFNRIVFVGRKIKEAAEQVEGSDYYPDVDALKKAFTFNEKGYHILIKGSRSGTLEKVLENL